MAAPSLLSFMFWLLVVAALFSNAQLEGKSFNCTGGAVYFSAHPVDGLLFQNPDLIHDLYVWKCVTTVVMTSGDWGLNSNFSQSLERGLQHSYALMAELPVDHVTLEETTVVRVGAHNLHSWSLDGMRNIQIVYIRLPDGSPSGRGYDAHKGESLSKLYNKEIETITSTDGNATYTLRDLMELIGFILHERKPNVIHTMNHKASRPDDHIYSSHADHSDHIISAKLVRSVITVEKINAIVKMYAGNIIRRLEANINSSRSDFAKKSSAFFKYAAYDDHMCHSLEQCKDAISDMVSEDDDVRYVAQYLGREYYVL